ncbi:hypothetical protein CBL_02603 [Carabus blaptoides fortunei]
MRVRFFAVEDLCIRGCKNWNEIPSTRAGLCRMQPIMADRGTTSVRRRCLRRDDTIWSQFKAARYPARVSFAFPTILKGAFASLWVHLGIYMIKYVRHGWHVCGGVLQGW